MGLCLPWWKSLNTCAILVSINDRKYNEIQHSKVYSRRSCSWGVNVGSVNTLGLRQNGRHFPGNIFKCIFLNENVKISIKISMQFVPKGPINYITTLVQIMAWFREGNKPLSEPMMVSLLTHICVTRPQWVNGLVSSASNSLPYPMLIQSLGILVILFW